MASRKVNENYVSGQSSRNISGWENIDEQPKRSQEDDFAEFDPEEKDYTGELELNE